jgi:hypothetical protein
MPHITIHEPMPLSGVAFYRSIGTLSYLSKLDPKITISIPKAITWAELSGTDIFYMQRPQSPADIAALQMAKNFNIPVWVDYDDLLHEIPQYNPGWKYYKKTGEPLGRIVEAITAADIVTVSTPAIRDYYLKYNKNIYVIENAHNDYRYPLSVVKDTIDSVNWRGSNTHRGDILSVADYIFNTAKEFPQWQFLFIGNDLWYITDMNRIKRCIQIDECDPIDYFYFIREWKAAIQINPLLDNAFNRAKSNIVWFEGTYAGSATIVPDLPEFRLPGAITYDPNDGKTFAYQLEKCMKSKSYRQEKYLESLEYIQANLLLSRVNKKRLEIIDKIILR